MQKKKILILGSTGMAGHMIFHYLDSLGQYDITDVSYRTQLTDQSILLDIKNKSALESLVAQIKPDFIINCIGILIKGSADTENAIYVNAYFPHLLKKAADLIGAKVIHLSTDCVFSGKAGNYEEQSFKDANDVYGRSKALGEIDEKNHLTIRTSIIGPEIKASGEGLFHWFMNQTGTITGFTNAIWGGVTTLELAKAIAFFIETNDASGIVHLTNGIDIAKYDLLNLIKNTWQKKNIEIKEGQGLKNINKSLRKSEVFKYQVPNYHQMLQEQYEWMTNNRSLYPNYDF
jgi:dTDP-4-dehydrorhamnose reductase